MLDLVVRGAERKKERERERNRARVREREKEKERGEEKGRKRINWNAFYPFSSVLIQSL